MFGHETENFRTVLRKCINDRADKEKSSRLLAHVNRLPPEELQRFEHEALAWQRAIRHLYDGRHPHETEPLEVLLCTGQGAFAVQLDFLRELVWETLALLLVDAEHSGHVLKMSAGARFHTGGEAPPAVRLGIWAEVDKKISLVRARVPALLETEEDLRLYRAGVSELLLEHPGTVLELIEPDAMVEVPRFVDAILSRVTDRKELHRG